MNCISYNIKTGNLMIYDRYIVRVHWYGNTLRFWYRKNGCMNYLAKLELEDLKKAIRFFVERGADFGKAINSYGMEE